MTRLEEEKNKQEHNIFSRKQNRSYIDISKLFIIFSCSLSYINEPVLVSVVTYTLYIQHIVSVPKPNLSRFTTDFRYILGHSLLLCVLRDISMHFHI